MQTDKMKQILLEKIQEESKKINCRLLKSRTKKMLNRILSASQKNDEKSNDFRWLSENAPLLIQTVRKIDYRLLSIDSRVFSAIISLICSDDFVASKDEIRAFFEIASSNYHLNDRELESIQSAFLIGLTFEIDRVLMENPRQYPRLFSIFHRLRSTDFSNLVIGYSKVEQIFRYDPSGIYPRMTRKTQLEYRARLKRLAKKKKISEEKLSGEILESAKKEGKHVGFYLKDERYGFYFYPLVFLLFGILLTEISIQVDRWIITVLSALPIYYFSRNIVDFAFGSLFQCSSLPQMRVDSVGNEQKTAVVITSLISKQKDIDLLFDKLKRYQINNSNENDEIYFGLLLDFPESKNKKEPNDEKLKGYLERKTNELNRDFPKFFSIIRERVYHQSEESYVGWERKRGAVQQLVHFLHTGDEFVNASVFSSGLDFVGSRYLITLDGDTELSIGQAKRLIGTIDHPLNRPEIGMRRGKPMVVSGHGIIQPKIGSTLLEEIKTPFGKICGNGSGEIVYAFASFDRMQSLYGEANFCGKGIIDVRSFDLVMENAIPEQRILSHDMPEGAMLRCGLMPDEYFSDSNPQSLVSYYKRQHRWIRGDIQNLFLFGRLKGIRKWIHLETVFAYLIPLSEFLLLCVSPFFGVAESVAVSLMILLFRFQPLLITAFRFLLEGNFEHFGRRFSKRMRNLLLNSFYQSLLDLSSIAFESYYFLDAVFRSFDRMLRSGKRLLQWQVYSPMTMGKSPFLFFSFSSVVGVLALFLCNNSVSLVIFLLWVFFPFFCYYLSRPYPKVEFWTESEKDQLIEMAKAEFRFFYECVSEKTNHLPPDNIQFEPVELIAMRTSPTNIGLYLASLLGARDLNLVGTGEMVKRIRGALETLEGLEKYRGHLFNWYDLNTLQVIGERFVSTVDSGNYVASLATLYVGLADYERESQEIISIRQRILSQINEADFSALYNFERGLFRVGIVPESKEFGSDYDLYMSEARITSYFAVATGQVPPSHWCHLKRPLLSMGGRVGVGSWSGTAFEYFMPPLFLPVIPDSLEDESLDFAFDCQMRKFAYALNQHKIFGISESGYALTDAEGNYQYKAFGVPNLSVQNHSDRKTVISPYSSFLMLERGRQEAIENLVRMKDAGLVGPYGYYEACDFQSNFLGDYKIVRSYMSHHKGMSILAIVNAVADQVMVKRFLSFGHLSAKKELLAERFPIEGKVIHKKSEIHLKDRFSVRKEKKSLPYSSVMMNGHFVTDGKTSLLAFDNGTVQTLVDQNELFHLTPEFGTVTIRLGEEEIDLFSCGQYEKRFKTDLDCVEYSIRFKKILICLSFQPILTRSAFLVLFRVKGYRGPVTVRLSFVPILQDQKEYDAHPAFQNLSMQASCDEKKILICKRGVESHRYLIVKSDQSMQTSFGKSEFSTHQNIKLLLKSSVQVRISKDSVGETAIPLIFAYSEKEEKVDLFSFLDGGYRVLPELRRKALDVIQRQNLLCCYDKRCQNLEQKLLKVLCRKKKRIINSDVGPVPRDFLWQFGISGDSKIVCFVFRENDSENLLLLEDYLRVFKRLLLAKLPIDLVVLQPSSSGYFDSNRDQLTRMISKYNAEYLLGKNPGIHFVPLKDEKNLKQFLQISDLAIGCDEALLPTEMVREDMKIEDFHREISENAQTIGRIQNRRFVLDKKSFCPDEPLSQVISNRNIGFVCDQNSLGYTWYRNAGLCRISRWNNLPDKTDGEKLFLILNGRYFDLIDRADNVQFLEHLAVYSGKIQDQDYRIVATAAEDVSAKMVYVELADELKKDAKLCYSFVPVMGRGDDVHVLIDRREDEVIFTPCRAQEIPFSAYLIVPHSSLNLSRFGDRLNVCFSAKNENVVYLGGFSSEEHHSWIRRQLKEAKVEFLISKEQNFLRYVMPRKFSSDLEFWISYQAVFARFIGKAGLYQSSGAIGFRDQLQDSLIFLNYEPRITKEHILRCASHQFQEGDVLHWWHTVRTSAQYDPGIRSRCGDDYLWLLFVTAEYIDKTGDETILSLPCPFLHGQALSKGENERYDNSRIAERAPLSEHLKRAAELALRRGLGSHLLPPMGCGDWNDGMNRIDGESVWLGMFAAISLHRIQRYLNLDYEEVNSYFEQLSKGIASAFNGLWFLRAYRPDGSVLGSDITLEEECSIDLITQAFSAFYAIEFQNTPYSLDLDFVRSALNSAYEILVDEKSRTVALLTKPFVNTNPTPGYIQRYCAGVRENGGQYTHAAVWFGIALIRFGNLTDDRALIEKGKHICDLLDPTKNLLTENYKRYQREPYVLCGDVYTANGFRGHGGWSWYTGAAAWYYQLLQEVKKQKERNA